MEELFEGMQNLLIECEMPIAAKPKFRTRFQKIAGEAPDEQRMLTQENKWGTEYRMYFDASDETIDRLRDEGYHVEPRGTGYGSDRAFRINNEKLFWALIEHGRRLGQN